MYYIQYTGSLAECRGQYVKPEYLGFTADKTKAVQVTLDMGNHLLSIWTTTEHTYTLVQVD